MRAQYLTLEMIRSAFQMSLCDSLDYTAVHKVLVEEEYVIQKDKNGNDIEVLTAVHLSRPAPSRFICSFSSLSSLGCCLWCCPV